MLCVFVERAIQFINGGVAVGGEREEGTSRLARAHMGATSQQQTVRRYVRSGHEVVDGNEMSARYVVRFKLVVATK